MKKIINVLLATTFVIIMAVCSTHAQDCDKYYIGFWSNGVDTMRITETTIRLNGGPEVAYTTVDSVIEDGCIFYCLRLEAPGDPSLSRFLNITITGAGWEEEMKIERYAYEVEAKHSTGCVGGYILNRAYRI